MCGIVGLISKRTNGFYAPDIDFFEQMLLIDMLRGMDSTGSFTVNLNTTVRLVKHETHAMNTFQTEVWDKYRTSAARDGRVIIGHNRKATKGNIKNENAHPFHQGDIILVHNGTLNNHQEIGKEHEVDSQAICQLIADKGYIEALKALRGAWGLVWYNLKEKKLYAITNGERPLSITEDKDCYYLSSELGLSMFLMNRGECPGGKRIALENSYRFLAKYELLTFDLTKQIVQLTKEDITEKVSIPFVHRQTQHGNSNGQSHYPMVSADRPAYLTPPQKTPVNLNTTFIHPIFQEYPQNSTIIVIPEKVTEGQVDGKDARYVLDGKGYVPGGTLVNVRGWFPSGTTFEDAADFGSEPRVLAKVSFVTSGPNPTDPVLVGIKEFKTDVMEETWTGTEIPSVELALIDATHVCDRCTGKINLSAYPSLTSVTPATVTKYTCVCHECVIASKDNMPQPLKEKLEKRMAA